MRDPQSILRIEVPIIVRLGERRITIAEARSISPGRILDLKVSADKELELLVNNRRIGNGTAVKLGENFGLKITAIGDQRARIDAMTQPAAGPVDPAEELAARLLAGQR